MRQYMSASIMAALPRCECSRRESPGHRNAPPRPHRPVVLADVWGNPGGGVPGDNPVLLKAMLAMATRPYAIARASSSQAQEILINQSFPSETEAAFQLSEREQPQLRVERANIVPTSGRQVPSGYAQPSCFNAQGAFHTLHICPTLPSAFIVRA